MRTTETGWPGNVTDLAASLVRTKLAARSVEGIMASSRPAIMLAATPVDGEDAAPIGATRMGGRPDLPPGMAWPERAAYADGEALARDALASAEYFHAAAGVAPPWMNQAEGDALLARHRAQQADTLAFLEGLQVDGVDFADALSPVFSVEECAAVAREAQAKADAARGPFPLAFLAQIDLATLPDGGDPALPGDGRLYVFYDLFLLPPSYSPASGVGLRVFHDNTPVERLERAPLPAPLVALDDIPGTLLKPCRIDARPVQTVVPAFWYAADALGLTERDRSAYSDWLSRKPGWPGDGTVGAHQLGGWPRAIQASMEGMAQLAANGIDAGSGEAYQTLEGKRLLEDAGAWRLLFQLGPDEAIGNILPGALNVLLREEDLAARRFDRAWAVYEQS